MKQISRWAGRHAPLAIALLIGCEVANAINGLLLGATLLGNWSYGLLMLSAGLVLAGLICVRIRYNSRAGYWVRRRYMVVAFVGNYLLFGLLGGLMEPRQPQPGVFTRAWAGRRTVVVVADTLAPATDSVQTAHRPAVTKPPTPDKDQRALYIVLAVLGFLLALVSPLYACGLACSHYGFAAVLVLIFGFVGGIVGSAYFIKRARQTGKSTTGERSRSGRRAGLIALGIAGALLLLLVL